MRSAPWTIVRSFRARTGARPPDAGMAVDDGARATPAGLPRPPPAGSARQSARPVAAIRMSRKRLTDTVWVGADPLPTPVLHDPRGRRRHALLRVRAPLRGAPAHEVTMVTAAPARPRAGTAWTASTWWRCAARYSNYVGATRWATAHGSGPSALRRRGTAAALRAPRPDVVWPPRRRSRWRARRSWRRAATGRRWCSRCATSGPGRRSRWGRCGAQPRAGRRSRSSARPIAPRPGRGALPGIRDGVIAAGVAPDRVEMIPTRPTSTCSRPTSTPATCARRLGLEGPSSAPTSAPWARRTT